MTFKTLLLIPPKYEVDFPPLGTPALAGFLKSRGKNVIQGDINHSYYLHFMDKLAIESKNPVPRTFRLHMLRQMLNMLFYSKENSSVYYSSLLKNPFRQAAYNDWTDSSYHFAENLLDSDVLHRFLEDEKENTFLQFYQESRLGEKIVAEGIDLLGVSVIGPSQIIATLTLAKYLKRNFTTSPKIVIGGQWPTLFHQPFIQRKDFIGLIDFHIRGEGETPLLSLIQHLEGERAIEETPNLSFSKEGQWHVTAQHTKENLRELPAPDFDGLPLTEYDSFMSSKIHLTYETSRECYWNRCTYCVDLPMPHEGYRAKPVDIVLKEIKELKEKYQFDSLVISDPAIAPRRLRDISQGLVDRGEQIPFWCFGRLEKNFTKETFEIAKKAGCYVVNFGMETASQRIMDFVDKGTQFSEVPRIMKDCAESGVQVALQMMMRLPSETYEEGLETILFLVDHKKWVTRATFNIYYCTPGSLMFNHPERFRIRIHSNQPAFRFFHLFDMLDENAMTYDHAEQLIGFYDVLLSKDKPSASVEAAFKEDALPLADSSMLAPALQDIETLQCRLSLLGETVRKDYFINKRTEELGRLTREQLDFISALDKNPTLTMAHDFKAKSEMIQGLMEMGLLQHHEKTPLKSCP